MPNPARAAWLNSFDGHIHSGKAFCVSHQLNALASSASSAFLFRVQDQDCHLESFAISATQSPALLELREGVVASSVGTALVPYNRYRDSSNAASSVLCSHSATLSNEGTVIHRSRVIGEKHAGSSGDSQDAEWILKPNTNYAFKVTNENGGAANIIFRANFYEG